MGRIKPLSWFEAHAAEMLRNVAEDRTPYVITQNGKATAVVIDIASYEETQEMLALLKLAALGRRDAREGRVRTARDAIAEVRALTRVGQ